MLGLILGLGLGGGASAAHPEPFEASRLPVERPIQTVLVVPPALFVLQEQDAALPFIPVPQAGGALSPARAAAIGAGAGVAQVLVNQTIDYVKRRNDAKRLALIESALGTHLWGARLDQEVRERLSSAGLGTGFEYLPEVPRIRMGQRHFDKPGRAWGLIRGEVAFSPNFRVLRIYLACELEDRRVVRARQQRLEMQRKHLRRFAVSYFIPLPNDVGLKQKQRVERWIQQDPVEFAARIEAGIVEVVDLANRYWPVEELDFEGERARFRADAGLARRGRVVTRRDDRVLIADRHDTLHSVPVSMLYTR